MDGPFIGVSVDLERLVLGVSGFGLALCWASVVFRPAWFSARGVRPKTAFIVLFLLSLIWLGFWLSATPLVYR